MWFRVLLCIGCLGFFLYSYIDTQNAVTSLRLQIPHHAKEIKDLKEVNTRLKYEIDLFESPEHLMQLARFVEFGHLKYPIGKEVLKLHEGIALRQVPESKVSQSIDKVTLATVP